MKAWLLVPASVSCFQHRFALQLHRSNKQQHCNELSLSAVACRICLAGIWVLVLLCMGWAQVRDSAAAH